MTNLVNLQRDMLFITPSGSNTGATWGSTSTRNYSNGTVYTDVAEVFINSVTHSSATGVANGIMIQQPRGERTPYRIKAYTSQATYIRIAYNTTQTGTDTYTDFVQLRCENEFDDIICLDDSNGSNPVFVGFTSPAASTAVQFALSVQRLNTVAPRFASTVS
jgi:hypothetical protein